MTEEKLICFMSCGRTVMLLAPGEAAQGEAAAKGERQFIGFKGLAQVITGAKTDGLDRFFDATEGCHDDDSGVFGKGVFAQQVQNTSVGEVQVDQGELKPQVAEQMAGLLDPAGFGHLRATVAQVGGEAFAERDIVFQQENFTAKGQGGFIGLHSK